MRSVTCKAVVGLVLVMLATAVPAAGEDPGLRFGPGDTIPTLLAKHQGKMVTLRLTSGDELAGKLTAVGEQLVHLAELSGREFFDAAVPPDAIVAVIVRTRDR
jgi:hypothetical protein